MMVLRVACTLAALAATAHGTIGTSGSESPPVFHRPGYEEPAKLLRV
jgi:hypothetical protein